MHSRNKAAVPVDKNQGALKIVWLALLLAMFAYTAVAFLFGAPDSPGPGKDVKTAFLAGGAALCVVSFLIYRISLSDERLRKRFSATEGMDPKKRTEEFSNGLLMRHVVPWGLNESVVLLGFVLAFIGKSPEETVPFSVCGIALQTYMYPKLDVLLEKTKDFL